jgi:hypothetical protein
VRQSIFTLHFVTRFGNCFEGTGANKITRIHGKIPLATRRKMKQKLHQLIFERIPYASKRFVKDEAEVQEKFLFDRASSKMDYGIEDDLNEALM